MTMRVCDTAGPVRVTFDSRRVKRDLCRMYQPPTFDSTSMARSATSENQAMQPCPFGTTMNAAASGPSAEPILPPTWNTDWARP